jgi:deazaflavin-dependent oxidoreductase (nitroreductase family)
MIPLFSHPTGLAIDRVLVRLFDRSLMGHMYHRAGGMPLRPHLLLRTIHWKTGRIRSVVLPYQESRGPAGEEWILVVGSHGGRPSDAVWSLNLRVHPEVWFRVGRRWRFGRARVTQGAEREAVWKQVTAGGAYLFYEKPASPRIIPAVVLELAGTPERPREDFAA